MASSLEDDLCCPVCCDVFRSPVVLSCSHSFCKDCLKTWWREKQSRECPICKAVSSTADPPVSLNLKNLCEAFLLEREQKESGAVCRLHAEKFKLFCLQHQQLVCLICSDSQKHKNHSFKPIHEVVQKAKAKLQHTVTPLKEKLKVREQVKVKLDLTAEHIKVQARNAEKKIKDQFKKLRQFLDGEEEARLAAVREEEQQKSQEMNEKIETVSRQMDALSDTIRTTEEGLRAEDVSFLLQYKAVEKRVQQRLLLEDPHLPAGALLDEVKHLGNLTFNVWLKMKSVVSYSPVILDPNTANPKIILSEDLSGMRRGVNLQLPDVPERFDCYPIVLGSKSFNSGTHSWNVEVGNSAQWLLGVFTESDQRKGHWEVESGMWRIGFYKGQYSAWAPSAPSTELDVRGALQRVRVSLDWSRGTLSFSNLNTKAHIHTFTHTFTQRVFPYMSAGDELRVLPLKVNVTLDHSSSP